MMKQKELKEEQDLDPIPYKMYIMNHKENP